MTLVDTEHTKYTYAACTGIALVGGVLGCCVVPFYLDNFKNADHSCSTCGSELAYKKAFDNKPQPVDTKNNNSVNNGRPSSVNKRGRKSKSNSTSINN